MKTFLKSNGKLLLLCFVSAISYYWFAYHLDRKNFFDLLLCFGVSFGVYFYVAGVAREENDNLFKSLAILFRLLFLFSIPPLSDDYFRFIWDGQLIANGINPFDHLPASVEINFSNKEELLGKMNSPDYYTVYPPIAQLIYFISAWLSPHSIFGSILIMRGFVLAAEIGIIFLLPSLLRTFGLKTSNALWYTMNPLVIVELTGNLHFEGIVLFFLLLSIYLLAIHRNGIAAISWAFAAATKLIPIFLLPALLRKLGIKRSFYFYLLFMLFFIALWIPFINPSFFNHFLESINLYYQTFEFNASIYYLVRWFGYELVSYNVIQLVGPWLSKIALAGVVFFQLRKSTKEWPEVFKALLFALSWYYAFALIVHPWYIITLVFISVFTPYRYAILWSALAILSYWAYSNSSYEENYWLIALEYFTVFGFFLYEVLLKKQKT